MASEAFAANPIGVGNDPEILLAKYESGADNEILLCIAKGPASPIPEAQGMG